MKGFGWLAIGGLFLSLLYTCGKEREVKVAVDYCNKAQDATYVGEVKGGTPIDGGLLITVVNPNHIDCPLSVVLRGDDMHKVGIGRWIRFKGSMSGPYLTIRDLEINPDGIGPISYVDVDKVEVWRIRDNRTEPDNYWFQLYGGKYGGHRLSIDSKWLSRVKDGACNRFIFNPSYEVVGVESCPSS